MPRIATFVSLVAMMLLAAFGGVSTSTAAVFTVINTNPTGPGSLDDAIFLSNFSPGPDNITFNLPGPPYTIFPALGGLTPLADPAGVTIDGLTQPGASCTNPPSQTNLLIEIDGANAGPAHGLWVVSSNNVIQGLVINNFEQDGIEIEGGGGGGMFMPVNADNNLVRCCYIGTDPPGLGPKGNGRNQAQLWAGVNIENQPNFQAVNNIIDVCLISANYAQGVQIIGPRQPGDVGFNHVLNCYIGVDATGFAPIGNRAEGVCLCEGTHDNIVSQCVISGNGTDGVGIQGFDNIQYAAPPIYTIRNSIVDNTIGLDPSRTFIIGNGGPGVAVGLYGGVRWGFAKQNLMARNYIAGNAPGVDVWEHPLTSENADENLISQNSMFANAFGIDLQDDFVTSNDFADADSLANQQMNFPVILSAGSSGGITTIFGTCEIAAVTVEVFKAWQDASYFGQGQIYLGNATLDGLGNWTFTTGVLVLGDWVTTTATDASNNTSEFSHNLQVTQQQPDEACCLQDGSCVDVPFTVCIAMQGVPQGPGTQCTAPQACCLSDGSCTMVDPLCCGMLQGVPQGPGSVCTTPVACCMPDGSCQDLDSLCCRTQGGIPDPFGVGLCMGDINGNQIDDACEPQELDTCEYYKAGYVDFAPNSMPDFDQKQNGWWNPQLGNFSWCGPTALANCLWWFDSKFEPSPVDPRPFFPGPGNPPPNDGYPLVQSYEPTGGLWDDHDTNNVIPFISKLGPVCGTDLLSPGTPIMLLEIGFRNWLDTVGLTGAYTSFIQFGPTYEQIRDSVLSSQDVILLLGFYELIQGGPDCQRVGGHYVTASGVCTTTTDICISDPFFDKNEGEPPPGTAHGSSVHNDASIVSGPHGSVNHDRYTMSPIMMPTCPTPATWSLVNYPNQWTADGIFTFANQNTLNMTQPPIVYGGGPIVVLIDAALIICPLDTSCCMEPMRGNINMDPGDGIDISDLTYLVNWMFKGGPQPPCFEEMDVNCSGTMDIADLTYLVNYMFKSGPPPCPCQCTQPAPNCWGP